ncbi:hypothetical protein LIER_19323 [Lithospermum erythrorhizon]|uniref:DUF7769 domain-containing protein n=1 Tax=Lithospermum erythrorhizon TaxID=34254 RepID=A0AAV3QHA8_LITER
MQLNRKNKWLANEQQDIIYHSLLRISNKGKLKRIATTEVANIYKLKICQVQRIWEKKERKGTPLGEIQNTPKRGRKKFHVDVDRILEIPLKQRSTLESLSNALDDENYYLHPREEEPIRTIQSKNFIWKVMFFAAMARPRFDNEGK